MIVRLVNTGQYDIEAKLEEIRRERKQEEVKTRLEEARRKSAEEDGE